MQEQGTVVIERTYEAPAHVIWAALTDPNEMKKWYFDIPDFKPEIGREFSFLAGSDEKKYLHLCRVTEVVKGRKIAYTWRYEGYTGESEVSFELFEEGNVTRLLLIHKGLDTFPADAPELAKENFVKGWTYFTGEALPKYLGE